MDAELAALNLQREAVAAVVQAEALEAALDVDSGAPSASVSKLLLEKDITERTSNYIEAQSKLHNHTVDTPHQTVCTPPSLYAFTTINMKPKFRFQYQNNRHR